MSDSLGEYAQKAAKAGITLTKLIQARESGEEYLALSGEEIDDILLIIKEQSAALKGYMTPKDRT